jgi:hypothetical protein
MRSTKEKKDTKTADVAPPAGIEVGRNTLFTGREWHTAYAIIRWPSEVGPAALQKLLGVSERVDISMFFEPVPQGQAAKFLAKQRNNFRSSRTKDLDALLDWELEVAEDDADRVGRSVTRGQGRFYWASVYVRIRGETEEDVIKVGKKIKGICDGLLLDCRPTTFRPLEAYASFLPLNRDALRMMHPFDSRSAAMGLYPFATGEMLGHPTGILMGKTIHKGSQAIRGGSPVFVDRWRLMNHNMVILAKSGGGKSMAAKAYINRGMLQGERFRIVDPDGEYVNLVRALGGVIITDPTQPVPDHDLICWSMGDADEKDRKTLVTQALQRIFDELDAAKKAAAKDKVAFRRTNVVVDEAMMALRGNPEATELMWNLVKRGRRGALSVWIITQDIADVTATEVGGSFLANCTVKILFRQDESALKTLTETFHLSEGEQTFLENAPQGHGLLVIDVEERGAIDVEVSDWEYPLCESTPVTVVALADR